MTDTDILSNLEPEGEMRGRFANAGDALRYIKGGHAVVTLSSKRSGTRFTYKITVSDNGESHFVKLLTGPDNNSSYQYMGHIWRDRFYHDKQQRNFTKDAPSSRAFAWAWDHIVDGAIPEALEIWHEGSCGRCGRRLTVPTSIAQGFGPECMTRVS